MEFNEWHLAETTATIIEVSGVLALGTLVIIRTFLAWSITMENEGHWPWQRSSDTRAGEGESESEA